VLFYWIVLDFPCLLTQFGLGKGFWGTLKLSLTLWTAQEIIYALELNGNVGFAAIDAFSANRVFE
jgi:hypothetical protein